MVNSSSTRAWRGKLTIFLLGGIVSITCLYFAFRKLNLSEVLENFSRMGFGAICVGLILANLHNFLLAKRWHLLVQPFGSISYWTAFWSLRISFFFNASLPARLGEPFRVFFITRKTKISAARLVGAMGADRFLDFITMSLLLYLSSVVLGVRGSLPPWSTILLSTLAFLALFLGLTQLPKHSSIQWLNGFLQIRARIFEGIASLKNYRILLSTVAISLLGWLIEAVIVVAFSHGVDSPISLYKAFMVVAAVTLMIAIPSSPGHIGTFELAAITMLSFFGIPPNNAAAIAILYHMVQLIPTLLIGAYGYQFYFLKGDSKHRPEHPVSMDSLRKIPSRWQFGKRLKKNRAHESHHRTKAVSSNDS